MFIYWINNNNSFLYDIYLLLDVLTELLHFHSEVELNQPTPWIKKTLCPLKLPNSHYCRRISQHNGYFISFCRCKLIKATSIISFLEQRRYLQHSFHLSVPKGWSVGSAAACVLYSPYQTGCLDCQLQHGSSLSRTVLIL